jgi:hypothetical protein
MAKIKKYCSVDPKYPISGYVVMLMVTTSQNNTVMYPLYQIYTSLDEVVVDIEEYKKILTEGESVSQVSDICFLFPLTFDRRYSLTREFWMNPDIAYTPSHRISAFMQVISKPELFSLLVTPSKQNRRWRFMAALPLFTNQDDASVRQFMLHSDWPVDESAKYAAVYRIEKMQVYNWVEKAIVVKSNVPQYEEYIN